MKTIIRIAVFLSFMLFLFSCIAMKKQEAPDMSSYDQLYRDIVQSDSSFADIPWMSLFTDPHLQEIIKEAIANNPDMQIAQARIMKAEANLRQSRAEFFPSLNAGINATFQNVNPNGQGFPELYQAFGSTSWEADIWGKYRSSKRANLASLLASEAYRRIVITDLVSSAAQTYYSLLALDAQLEITRQTVEKRIRNVETMEVMKENDVITGADLVLSQANRYSAEVTIPDLNQRIYETENTLSLLMGRNPGPIERGRLDEQELSADLKTGVPAQLLANRPDVIEAEYHLRYFAEMVNVARANFYPAVTLTARSGLSETNFRQLFQSPFFFWNIAAGLTQPIFNFGLNRQRYSSAKADLIENEAVFRNTLLRAGQEVVNAMHEYQSATDKLNIRSIQIGYLEKSVEYTMELLKYTSNTNYIDVLTSEVNLLSAQLGEINDKLQQLQAIVKLYQSLGGGWKE